MDTSQRMRVLVVEPLSAVRQSLEFALAGDDCDVVSGVATLAEAQRLLPGENVQVLLVGLSAPLDIAELNELRQTHPALRILLLDQVANDANANLALRGGLAGYLTKEQPLASLKLALGKAAAGDRTYAPEIAERLVFSVDGVRLAPLLKSSPLELLTQRELDVLIYIARGYTVRECAEVLGIRPSTVDNHKSRLMHKLDIHKSIELTHFAVREGLLAAGYMASRAATQTGDRT